MTKYEKLAERLKNLYNASMNAQDKEMASIWWLQYQRLEHKMLSMTIKEAQEVI